MADQSKQDRQDANSADYVAVETLECDIDQIMDDYEFNGDESEPSTEIEDQEELINAEEIAEVEDDYFMRNQERKSFHSHNTSSNSLVKNSTLPSLISDTKSYASSQSFKLQYAHSHIDSHKDLMNLVDRLDSMKAPVEEIPSEYDGLCKVMQLIAPYIELAEYHHLRLSFNNKLPLTHHQLLEIYRKSPKPTLLQSMITLDPTVANYEYILSQKHYYQLLLLTPQMPLDYKTSLLITMVKGPRKLADYDACYLMLLANDLESNRMTFNDRINISLITVSERIDKRKSIVSISDRFELLRHRDAARLESVPEVKGENKTIGDLIRSGTGVFTRTGTGMFNRNLRPKSVVDTASSLVDSRPSTPVENRSNSKIDDLETNGDTIMDQIINTYEKPRSRVDKMNVQILCEIFKLVASRNDVNLIKRLLKDDRITANILNDVFKHCCVEGRHLAVRIDPGMENNYCIKIAVEKGYLRIVSLLIQDPRVDATVDSNWCIRKAAELNYAEIVECLLLNCNPLEDGHTQSALKWCIQNDNDTIFEIMKDRIPIGVDVVTLTVQFHSPYVLRRLIGQVSLTRKEYKNLKVRASTDIIPILKKMVKRWF
ncbi:hypothetical protein HK103_001814 [Boothiomyces macroporosus]|uniref:Ankyrin repeat protein n=1 Tax=Boothiomyces macroporosus TaxID=261099 RepID=A0AAD5UDM3_9FUNG|nr:hypothetical protein HK103_001814 [Boothiomyces macroporosus]